MKNNTKQNDIRYVNAVIRIIYGITVSTALSLTALDRSPVLKDEPAIHRC